MVTGGERVVFIFYGDEGGRHNEEVKEKVGGDDFAVCP